MRHYDYTWNQVNNSNLVWYNEEALTAEQPVVIVEGQFDKMRVSEVYPHVMANMTAKPIPAKMKKLAYAPAIILMTDNDDTADESIKKWSPTFRKMLVNGGRRWNGYRKGFTRRSFGRKR